MTTIEQQFKQLLDIACKNGFEMNEDYHNTLYAVSKLTLYFKNKSEWKYSINDLILRTNFFDCLFKDWSLFTTDYKDTLIELRADFINSDGILHIGDNSLELSCHKNTAIQFKKFQWVLEVEKGTALQWLFDHFDL